MKVTLDWLGTATFRLTLDDVVVFLDAYMDRVPSAPPVGLSAKDVQRADFVLVGHSHFDHLAGAEIIAATTGARVIGSSETCRVLRGAGVAAAQLTPSHGGERHRLSEGVTVRVVPSLHACIWCHEADAGAGTVSTGLTGLTEDERAGHRSLVNAIGDAAGANTQAGRDIIQHVTTAVGSRDHGGALGYYIETPAGSLYWHDSSGCWTGVLAGLRPDVALLACAGRANVDGEPIQGSPADFIALQARLLGGPRAVVLSHHDNWMPPRTKPDFDLDAVRGALARESPGTVLLSTGYLEGTVLFGA